MVKIDGESINIRPLEPEELHKAHLLTQEAGFTTTMADLRNTYTAYGGGFDGGFTEDGNLVSLCAAPTILDQVAYVSLFITKISHQKRGIGKTLMRHTLNRLSNYNVLLHAVGGTEEMYDGKFGFNSSPVQLCKIKVTADQSKLQNCNPKRHNIQAISNSNVDAVLQYDKKVAGYDRREFLKLCFADKTTFARCLMDKECCVGYIMIRKMANDGSKMRCHGFYADSVEHAKALLSAVLLEEWSDGMEQLFMFVAEDNRSRINEVVDAVGDHQKAAAPETLMYTKSDVRTWFDLRQTYCAVSSCACLL